MTKLLNKLYSLRQLKKKCMRAVDEIDQRLIDRTHFRTYLLKVTVFKLYTTTTYRNIFVDFASIFLMIRKIFRIFHRIGILKQNEKINHQLI